MAGQSMRVSILMPLRNAGRYVEAALHSILLERDIPLEIIVVDDSSTDDSTNQVIALRDQRISLLNSEGAGISACLNTALSFAKGSIIMRCDADDLFPAGRIQEQVSLLDEYEEYDAICGSFSTIDVRGKTLLEMSTGTSQADITERLAGGTSPTHLGTYAIRSRAFRELRGFRPYFDTAEDLDFQFRLARVGRVLYIPKEWYRYRIHSSSVTHRQATERRLFFARMAEEFAVQRQKTGLDLLEKGIPPSPPQLTNSLAHEESSHVQELLVGKAWIQFNGGQRYAALCTSIRAIAVHPRAFDGWRNLIVLVGKSVVQPLRRN
jgi:glycosyltransferase involved in cell wall biosynthesis